MRSDRGLVFACHLDGRGGGTFGGWKLVEAGTVADGWLWVHLDVSETEACTWVLEHSGLDGISARALVTDRSRPRTTARGAGLLVDLRGVNLNPGARPDDMISVRVFLEERRVITTRRRRLMAVEDLRAEIREGVGPVDPGDFLFDLGDKMLLRMVASFESIDERIEAMHDRIGEESHATLRAELSDMRAQVIALRRYLSPQRDALAQLQTVKVKWLTESHREHLREIAERTARRVEDLESARDRAGLVHEELTSLMAEQMNRTMYLLAIVAAIFMPLGLITGLLGINVDGIPGEADFPWAFWIVCAMLVGFAGIGIWLFRRMKWL